MTRPRASDDRELCAKLAKQALTRPSDYMRFDDRWYTTHGLVLAWADRGDDILAESNYHAALELLNAAVAHDESGDSEERGDDVEDTSSSHWLVGSLRELFVRVYVPGVQSGGEQYTPAFLMAVDIHAALRDYPVLDDSDYSEREYAAWEEVNDQAFSDVARDYPDDSDAERMAFWTLIMWDDALRDRITPDGFNPGHVSWDLIGEVYAEVRNAHFEWLAQWHSVIYVPPGQLALFMS